ncbi:MAG: RDD family protein [Deltaproteobacteria bacterium]|nr:RDD family protein [Deltaproteobacteria bacterium]
MAEPHGSEPRVEKITGKVSVDTPEQIQFTFDLAGAGSRMLAYLIDLSIRLALLSVIGMIVMVSTGWASPGLATGLLLIIAFAVEWGYHTIIEWLWNGFTPGKRALRIRVVRADGVRVDFVRSAMRNLLRAADIFPFFYAAGLLTMFFTGTQRRLGDFAADTMVVREAPAKLRELPPLPEDVEALPPGSVAELKLRDRDLALIDEFFRRRHLFSPERAEELAAILVEPARARLGLADGDSESLLAAILIAGHEVRSSWYGRATAASIPAAAPPRRPA